MSLAKKENIQSVQFLRGIAAFLVLLCHSNAKAYFSEKNILTVVSNNGWMGVNIFFIISGFIIPYSMFNKNYKLTDFGNFFIKRIARIEPPYIISLVLVLFLSYSTTRSAWYHGPAFTINWQNLLGHLGYINVFTGQPWLNVAYWTLAIEFEYYIILALLYPLLTHRNKAVMMITFFSILASTFIPVTNRHIIIYLPFFLMGIALFLFHCERISILYFAILLVPTCFLAFYFHGPVSGIIAVLVLPCIYFIKKVPKIFLFLGTLSYSLYLTHNVIISRYMALSARYLSRVNVQLRWLSCLIFCLFCAWLYYTAFEKPFVTLSKKLKFNHKGRLTFLQKNESLFEEKTETTNI